jgi:hypothetical protein
LEKELKYSTHYQRVQYVLIDPCLEIGENSTAEEREAQKVRKKANEMARCYMLASMSNVLQSKHENRATVYDIDYSLMVMLANKNRPVR